jgi:hypothetical protein
MEYHTRSHVWPKTEFKESSIFISQSSMGGIGYVIQVGWMEKKNYFAF